MTYATFPNIALFPHPTQQEKVLDLYQQVIKPKRIHKTSLDTFLILCANLGHARCPIKIPLNRTYWSEHKEYGIHPAIVDQVKAMRKADYLDWDKGCETWKRPTFVTATEKFHEYFNGGLHIDYKPKQWIIARKRIKTGEQKQVWNVVYKRFEFEPIFKYEYYTFDSNIVTENIERILHASYTLNHRHSITLNGVPVATALRCIFSNQELTLGGRLYTATSYGTQSYSKSDRKNILIDGMETVELDFASLHINMLRSKEGLRPVDDAYTMVLDRIPGLNSEYSQELRDFLKGLLQSMLNVSVPYNAVRSGNYTTNYQPLLELFQQDPDHVITDDDRKVRTILKEVNLSVKELVSLFEDTHYKIEKYFYKGMGLELQNYDSKIALKVLDYFTSKLIIILPIHDSFIVERQSSNLLMEKMNDAYKEVMNSVHECPIK
jgi:hypothetical protein